MAREEERGGGDGEDIYFWFQFSLIFVLGQERNTENETPGCSMTVRWQSMEMLQNICLFFLDEKIESDSSFISCEELHTPHPQTDAIGMLTPAGARRQVTCCSFGMQTYVSLA